jgi:precorrin-2/cobalt-factor-2 C20-methyltransferase
MQGKFYGIGVGPGDPELITLKAYNILSNIGIIAFPILSSKPSFAFSIIKRFVKKDVKKIELNIPFTDSIAREKAYDISAEFIANELEIGNDVALICEGDPFIYGSFIYIWDRLKGKYSYEIIPGISSIIAGPNRLNIPIACGNDIISIVPGPLENNILKKSIMNSDVTLVLKVGRHFDRLLNLLSELSLLDNSYYISNATLENQYMAKLAELTQCKKDYFSMILIKNKR